VRRRWSSSGVPIGLMSILSALHAYRFNCARVNNSVNTRAISQRNSEAVPRAQIGASSR